MPLDWKTSFEMSKKWNEEANKKRDYSKLKLLKANEIVDKIVKGDKDFSNVRIAGVDWARRDLSDFNFSGSKIEWCIFSGCKMKNANFSGAFIDWCLFDSTNLSKCNFRNSTIYDSGFINADMSDTDFTNGDIRATVLENIIGRQDFTNCTQIRVVHSMEEAVKTFSLENIMRYMEMANLPLPHGLLSKVKINDLWSSGEKLKFVYDIGRQASNPEGNLGTYNLKKAGKNSLGEYKSENSGVYTSGIEYGAKKDRKRTDVYSR